VRRALSLALLLLLSAAGLAAQSPESFSFSGDETSIVLAEGRERTRLIGNARVVSDATTIEAGEIELYGEDFRYVLCSGGVSVVDEENNLYFSSGELFYDRETELTRARYRVVLEDRENEIVVKGGFVETRENGAYVQAQIGVRILRDDLTARSEFVRYNRDLNRLELSGYPVVFWQGDEYRASRITIDLDRDEIELEGGVEGTVTSDEESEDASQEATAPGDEAATEGQSEPEENDRSGGSDEGDSTDGDGEEEAAD
jgi:lipopolysaccharide export system protein LptA